MDDRILIVPAMWAPGMETVERWPAVRALLSELRAFLPVDLYQWASLRGVDREGSWRASADHFAASIRSCHHILVLDSGGAESLLWAIARAPEQARSLIMVGFLASPEKLEATGQHSLAGAMAVNRQVAVTNAPQILRLLMQGADEQYLSEQIKMVERDVDPAKLAALMTPGDPGSQSQFTLTQPSLHLQMALTIAGAEESAEIYRTLVPGTRTDRLESWPLKLHEEESGKELAGKVVPFLKEVIAERSAE
jgi:hypothetical protein